MAKKIINGTDIAISIGGVVVGCSTEGSISVTTDMRDAACKESGDFYDGIPGTMSAELSIKGIVIIDNPVDSTAFRAWDFAQMQYDRTLVDWVFGTTTTGEMTYVGNGYITDFSMSAPDKETASYDVKIKVVGQFTIEPNA